MMQRNETNRTFVDDNSTLQLLQNLHWIASGVIGSIIVLMGITGNSLSILVWNRKSMRCSTGTYLTYQSIVDICVLVIFTLTDVIAELIPEVSRLYSFGVFYAYIGYPFFNFFVILSFWLVVGVTVDRYIQVCWPHKAKDFCSKRKVKVTIFIITAISFVVNIPNFYTFRPTSPHVNTSSSYGLSDFGKGQGRKDYDFWVHCIVLVLVPWFSIFVLNILILKSVFKSGRKSNVDSENARHAKTRLTRLVLIVTFTFLFLIICQCITHCFYMMPNNMFDMQMVNEAYAIAELGVVINSSINFILYCMTGTKFRKELALIFHTQENKVTHIHVMPSSKRTTETEV